MEVAGPSGNFGGGSLERNHACKGELGYSLAVRSAMRKMCVGRRRFAGLHGVIRSPLPHRRIAPCANLEHPR